ncbi:MAG: site-2 protease family protein [bacterium]
MEAAIAHTWAALMPYFQVRDGFVLFLGLVVSITLHEFGHAAAAVWLGDPTPRSPARLLAGRITDLGGVLGVTRGRDNRYTVNPLAHADPIGTVVLPLAALFLLPQAMLFGWGRPVPFDPYAARAKVPRSKMIVLVSLAGPTANILQALFFSGLLVLLIAIGARNSGVELAMASTRWVETLVWLNFLLAFFNLLPVPPLDGGHILTSYLSRSNPDWARWLNQYGLFVFLLLFPILPFLLQPIMVGSMHWTSWLVAVAGG